MSIKITTTEAENQELTLLFEFNDYEVPEQVDIDYNTSLANNRFAGGLQTNQINGIYLEPISLSVLFKGTMVMKDGTRVSAKDRFDQLARLQGRPIKLFIENFKTICIIKSIKITFKNVEHIEAEIVFQPHDFQLPIKPTQAKQFAETFKELTDTVIPKPPANENILKAFFRAISDMTNVSEQKGALVNPPEQGNGAIENILNTASRKIIDPSDPAGNLIDNPNYKKVSNNTTQVESVVKLKTETSKGVTRADIPSANNTNFYKNETLNLGLEFLNR